MTHQTLSLEKYWKLFPATLMLGEGEVDQAFSPPLTHLPEK